VEFKVIKKDFDFHEKNVPSSVFVKGEVLDLKRKKFPKSFQQFLYNYFVRQYDAPETYEDFIEKLNGSKYFGVLKKCYSFL
jgi:hypothetical protein